MPKPVTPLVGCDVFVVNDAKEVLLVRRSDNGLWALPGGCHDLGETPAECAVRECHEETGLEVELLRLLGVWSSNRYEYVHYPWRDNEFCHLMFEARLCGGQERTSGETVEVGWFAENALPPLSDGHQIRVAFGYAALKDPHLEPHFE